MSFPLYSGGGAGGDVNGPGSSTDKALTRFSGTGGKTLQNSVPVVSDAGELTGLAGLSSGGNVQITGASLEYWTFLPASGDFVLTGGGANMVLRVPLSASLSSVDKLTEFSPLSGIVVVDTSASGAPATSQAAGTIGEFRRVSTTCYYCFATGTGASDRWAKWTVTTSF